MQYLFRATNGEFSEEFEKWIAENLFRLSKNFLTDAWLQNYMYMPKMFFIILKIYHSQN